MRLSCCAYSYRQYLQAGEMTLEEFVDTAADIGCEGVELTAYYFPSLDRPYLNALKRYVHRRGLSVSGTAVGSNFAQADAGKRREHVRMTKEWIERSVILGAATLRVFAGPVAEGSDEQEAFSWVVECLRDCAQKAEEEGVLLALENHGGITATADQTLAIHRAVGSDWLGINLDFGNYSGDVLAQFAACAPLAVASHAKVTFNGESGRERVDYRCAREVMDASGYRGWLAIEYEEPEEPRDAVPAFAAELAAVLNS
jgi:sugar phosphate isomerase/epimerase